MAVSADGKALQILITCLDAESYFLNVEVSKVQGVQELVI